MNNIMLADDFYQTETSNFFIHDEPVVFYSDEIDALPIRTIYKYISKDVITSKKCINYRKTVEKRLDFLEENLDEEQDIDIFTKSKQAVLEFINRIKFSEQPLIGVDNTGYIVFEWHQYNMFDLVMMLFKADSNISLTAIKEKKIVKKATGIISEIVNEFYLL
jgi:hypothetical protein